MSDTHAIIIPGLDVLIGDPKILCPTVLTIPKAQTLIIPQCYVLLLDLFEKEHNSGRAEAAKQLTPKIKDIARYIHNNNGKAYTCKNGMKIIFHKDSYYVTCINKTIKAQDVSAINAAIETAKHYIGNTPKSNTEDIAILTGSDILATLALFEDIDTEDVIPEVYTGRRKVKLTEETMAAWCSKNYITLKEWNESYPDEEALSPNEFIEFEANDDLETEKRHFTYYIGRFHEIETDNGTEKVIEQIHYIHSLPKFIELRTVGQAMFAEALLAPVEEIPIVICPSVYGTGKTFLATGIGAQLSIFEKRPRYEGIFICPRDSQLGKEIGFLPGDETEKTIAKAMPIIDNLEAFLKLRKDKEKGGEVKGRAQIKKDIKGYLADFFEFVSVINMGGRSISDRWIIYDEAQEYEQFQMDQLMKRIGDRSKLIITGDPEQIFNKHLSKRSNGLTYAATKMRGSTLTAIVSMEESEITRSEVAKEIANFIG